VGATDKPGTAEEFAARVKAGALPVMKKMDGFRGYFLVTHANTLYFAIDRRIAVLFDKSGHQLGTHGVTQRHLTVPVPWELGAFRSVDRSSSSQFSSINVSMTYHGIPYRLEEVRPGVWQWIFEPPISEQASWRPTLLSLHGCRCTLSA